MFGELPKLFDRNFAIGFFLPVAIFLTLSGLILAPYPFGPNLSIFLNTETLVDVTLIGLLSWAGGIFLLVINRDLYRLLEGYGVYNPLQYFRWFEWRIFDRATTQLQTLDQELKQSRKEKTEFPLKSRRKRNRLLRQLSEDFPDKEEFILSTAFGNVLRAFEVYPRVMYGLDAIDAWERLLAVIPKDYSDRIEGAKAHVDFWINLGLVLMLLQAEYIALIFITWTPFQEWVVLLLLAAGTIALLRATISAKEWGQLVKSAFDVYRFDLLETLGVNMPRNREEEKLLWQQYSQAIIYRSTKSLPNLKWPPSRSSANKNKSK
jgi:hypothetical protein